MTRCVSDLLRRYLAILTWGTEYSRRTLDAPPADAEAFIGFSAGTRKFGNVMGYKVTSGHAVIQ